MVERLIRWLVNSTIRKMPEEETVVWRKHFLEALTRPLSLFIWSYGIYGALSPLYIHFVAPDGSNLVHSVAQKAAVITSYSIHYTKLYDLRNAVHQITSVRRYKMDVQW